MTDDARVMAELTAVERRLLDDLDAIEWRAPDEKFAGELYRALTRNIWRREGEADELSPSFRRAEWLVNRWRRRHGKPPLDLAWSGGEGQVDRTIETELGRLGWTYRPLPTDRRHPAHRGMPESPPRPDPGGGDAR